MLHPEDLFLGISVIGDENEVFYIRRIDFFEFPAEEKRKINQSSVQSLLLFINSFYTYDAMNMAAVPTNCNFPLTTLI